MTDYEALRQRHVEHAMGLLPEHIQRVSWDAAQIRAERERGLRSLLRTAHDHSAWHRERLDGIDIDHVTDEQVADLPVMTKDDLMANWDAIVTDPRLNLAMVEDHLDALTGDAYLLDTHHGIASGGSSGRRGVFVCDWDAWAVCFLGFARFPMWDRMTDPALSEALPVTAMVAADRATHMTSAVGQTFKNPAITVHRFPITTPLEEIVAGLNELQPPGLNGYTSALAQLAHEALAGRLTIAPLRVTATSEPIFPEMRALIEKAWGVRLGNWWGTSEGGPTGISCGRGAGMHLADDLLIVEPVDAAGRPVPPGTQSDKVYLTNLYNPLLPLIRYEITDRVTVLDEPCPCGSGHRRIADIEGRTDDVFEYAGGVTVHPFIFRSVLGQERNIVEYQVRQTPQGAEVAACTNSALDARAVEGKIEAKLAELGVAAPRVTIALVDRLERQSSGKLKRFVPLPAAG